MRNSGRMLRKGGSPRVRGRRGLFSRARARPGWIPAGAGETGPVAFTIQQEGVDPRGGGGDTSVPIGAPFVAGGSPRGRGRPGSSASSPDLGGWIPAGAGETASYTACDPPRRVDPRGGGGDRAGGSNAILIRGGSPRGRGRLGWPIASNHLIGWIPAGAGETGTPGRSTLILWVDPRGCGGDSSNSISAVSAWGGSPRVRGRRHRRLDGPFRRGWIPAGAGETRRTSSRCATPRVDPRGCGGDAHQARDRSSSRGGSPRVRGRPGEYPRRTGFDGWIPAGAGETSARAGRTKPRRVDPRGCGGDASIPFLRKSRKGGSPRVRGRLVVLPPRTDQHGWIPAGAGETYL